MPRSSKRHQYNRQCSKIAWPAILGSLFLATFLVSTAVIFIKYREEITDPSEAEHHFEEWLKHLSLRRLHRSKLAGSVADSGAFDHNTFASLTKHHGELATVPQKQLPNSQPRIHADEPVAEKGVAARVQKPAADVNSLRTRAATASGSNKIIWQKHEGKSCQNYADGDSADRSLEDSKAACVKNDACAAIVCGHGREVGCSLRAAVNLIDYAPEDCYELIETNAEGVVISAKLHPAYNDLLHEYPFQQVSTQTGRQVNIILVRSQVSRHQFGLYQKYKDDILFLGISSMNDYPLKEPGSGDPDEFTGMFPGFLHMMRDPEKHFPSHVKTLLMSQSDFQLPEVPARDYSEPKKYDFTYSASDCDVSSDGHGWCGWSKNWTFVKEALVMMCGEFNLKGVLVATKDKSGRKAYSIPESCKGKMTQTTYLPNQQDYFNYLKHSRFALLPQVHDASPRVSSQALAHDVPILMNWHIQGGWKYVTEKTGEFFHDIKDFRTSLQKILKYSEVPHYYEPRKWVLDNYGNQKSGERLLKFVKDNFGDRVKLPKGTKWLQI